MKTLSIAIPVYNTEKYIRRCVDSLILKDILEDIEIILVNDVSKDKSIEILNEYKEKYPQSVIVIDKPNGGHGSTINAALGIASGKYFRVLDSDDWFDSKNFITFIKKLKNENADVVITNYKKEYVYNGYSEEMNWEKLKTDVEYEFDKFDLKLLGKEYFVMANSTYKTEILRRSKLKLLEKTFYVDMQYNIIPIQCVKTFTFYKLDIYRYFIGRPEQSMNLQNFVKNRHNHEKVIKYLLEYYTQNVSAFSTNKKEYIKQILFYMLTTHYYIYCVYAKKDKKLVYSEIKEFDDYFKKLNPELYNKMDKIGQIKCNRKTKFMFVKISPQLFSKFVSLCGRLIQRKENNLEK